MNIDFHRMAAGAAGRRPLRFAVAGAASIEVLKAVVRAKKAGIMDPLLIGREPDIRRKAARAGIRLGSIPVLHADDEPETAERAARLAAEDRVDAVMKGDISTPVVMHAVLDPRHGLRTGALLSHVAVMEVPGGRCSPFVVTDSGMVTRPTLEQKAYILENAVAFTRRLGVRKPRIAVLAANEKPSAHLPETLDAVELVRMAEAGRFGNVFLEGPMAVDVAFSARSARIKNIRSHVAGKPDILLVPDVTCGNIFAKGLVMLAGARISGLVVGAKKPIVLVSRAETADAWLRSMLLAAAVCRSKRA
jgi:phosphate butyryltransferase